MPLSSRQVLRILKDGGWYEVATRFTRTVEARREAGARHSATSREGHDTQDDSFDRATVRLEVVGMRVTS